MRIAKVLGLAGLAALLGQSVQAQDWPNRTLTLIVPFAAGGGIDGSARVQAIAIGEILGQSVVVENIGAAAGTVGTVRVAKSTPDGYTFLIGNSGTHAYSQSLFKKPPYDPAKDFDPIGLVTESPRLLITRKDLPVNTLQEFVAYVKANQDKMQYGSAGVGSGTHLPCALLNTVIGVTPAHVPYRGSGGVIQDLIGGRLDYMCESIQSASEQVKGGTLKGIAIMAPKRAAILPDLPTTGEQGVAGVEATIWNGYFFPKGTPQPIIARMNKVMTQMLERPDVRKRMDDLGLDIVPPAQRTPEYLAQLIPLEVERWGKVIRAAGIVGQ